MKNIEEKKDSLRDRVTKFMDVNADPGIDNVTRDPAKLIAELRTHQIELEM